MTIGISFVQDANSPNPHDETRPFINVERAMLNAVCSFIYQGSSYHPEPIGETSAFIILVCSCLCDRGAINARSLAGACVLLTLRLLPFGIVGQWTAVCCKRLDLSGAIRAEVETLYTACVSDQACERYRVPWSY